MKDKKLQIRNSTAEFLMFTAQAGENGIEVRFQNETIWLSQKMMAVLFDCSIDNISLHLKNIFKTKELDESSVTEDFSITASDGKKYNTKHYNYLTEKEIKNLDRFVTMYLDYAETQAEKYYLPNHLSIWHFKFIHLIFWLSFINFNAPGL